jgi:hypothetical protein
MPQSIRPSPTGVDFLRQRQPVPAGRIAEYIFDHGLAGVPGPPDIDAHIRAHAYKPVYPAYA